MPKKFLLIILLLISTTAAFSRHLKGGWIHYEYEGPGSSPNTSRYEITVNQYLFCQSSSDQIDGSVYLGIYDGGSNQLLQVVTIEHTSNETETRDSFDPCISNPPTICYRIDHYVTSVDLPNNSSGYTLAVQRCCRIEGIVNLVGSQSLGITYTVSIPGNNVLGNNGKSNTSPIFKQNDVAVLCINSPFTLDFSATDAVDHDSLVYNLCPGLTGGNESEPRPNPPSNPPYDDVIYSNGFSGESPLGSKASIDPKTGIISGIAPSRTGDYVVAVCATEYRNGIAIAVSRKEIHISIANCVLDGAYLQPSYITCDGYTFSFENESQATNLDSYLWEFGYKDTTSTEPTPTVTFPNAGQYNIKLTVKNAAGCESSASTVLNVYPGFKADFSVAGSCLQNAFVFTDKSTTVYGVVDSWRWNFGDPNATNDTSDLQKPTPYKYSQTGNVNAELIVTNSKGCIDTLTKEVVVYDKPVVTVPFRDTLICNIDQLQLSVSSEVPAIYTWTPAVNITNNTIANPIVSPKKTTTYYVKVDDGNGCVNTDSILVNVVDRVTLSLGSDTTICLGDSIQLHPVTNGIYFTWSPAETLSSDTTENPVAVPGSTTTYHLNSSVGACSADDDIIVRTAPYPKASVDTAKSICFGSTIQLHAAYSGTDFTWSPTNSLLNASTVNPTAGPSQTTSYIFTAYDHSVDGCPKPVSDSVTVIVIPPVQVFAGNDTNIVVGQTLQLQATGAEFYQWTPPTGMSNSNTANPQVNLPGDISKISYQVRGTTAEGCQGFDSVTVYQYKTLPEIFIPSAFTPDNDGRNDILKPIIAGMKQLDNFSVYNRWGQLLFTTQTLGQGWDGTFNGERQPPGTYVYLVKAIDYMNRPVLRKGTVVLVR